MRPTQLRPFAPEQAAASPLAIASLLLTAVVTVILVAGCASGSSASGGSGSAAPGAIEYYYGTSSTTSPDGKIAYGPPVMTLVRREISPAQSRIVETATRDGRTLMTTLQRVEDGRFSAQASDASFGGGVEFEGSDWQWDRWRYALELADGSGVIEGTGKIDGKWLEADRFLVSGNGERRSRITDRLARITQEEYERRLSEMTAPASKPASKRR